MAPKSKTKSVPNQCIKFGLLSVNQLAAKIKLMEIWKSLNNDGSPISLDPYRADGLEVTHDLRPKSNRVFNKNCRLQRFESSFHVDAARIWNAAPMAIRNAKSLATAKTKIVKFCVKLPV